MSLTFCQVESFDEPATVDETSSPNGVYVRKNITSTTATGTDGTKVTKYSYQEAFLTSAEYQNYALSQAVASTISLNHDDDVVDNYTLTLIEEGKL